VANYGGGSQRRPHAHSILSSPDGKFVYAADLGRDKVEIYQLDVSSGKLTPVGNADVPAGSGPRHMAFSHNGERLYVLNELTLTVSKYARDVESGGLQLEETVAVMALYAGVRDLKNQGRDLVSVMSLDAEGDMKLVQEHASGTWIPRHLEISPSGKWVLVAGQKGNKLVVHARLSCMRFSREAKNLSGSSPIGNPDTPPSPTSTILHVSSVR